jgi:hypothetical protein
VEVFAMADIVANLNMDKVDTEWEWLDPEEVLLR